MAEEVTKGMQIAQNRAEQMTRTQIDAAMQINAQYFQGEGLTYFPAILQALSQNYAAQFVSSNLPS